MISRIPDLLKAAKGHEVDHKAATLVAGKADLVDVVMAVAESESRSKQSSLYATK